MTTDENVGAAVRRNRGQRSQKSVAVSMRAAGHEAWRQTLVAKVEAGERALRLTEAVDLSAILGCSLPALAGVEQGLDRAAIELQAVRGVIDARLDEIAGER